MVRSPAQASEVVISGGSYKMQCSLGQFQGGESFLCGVAVSWVHVSAPNRGRTHLGFLPNRLCFTVRSPPYFSSLHFTASSSLKSEEQQQGDEVLEEEEEDDDDDDDDDDFAEEQQEGDEVLEEEQEEIISFLVNSCGLSPQSAESASPYLTPHRKDNAKVVIDLLKSYGVSDANVSLIIAKSPKYLLSNPTATFLPKLEFLRSIGASNSDIDIIVTNAYVLLCRSLERRIIPFYDKLKSILVSDEKVVKCMKRLDCRTLHSVSQYFDNNLSMLREIEISQSVLSYLVVTQPSMMGFRPDTFRRKVHQVLDLGFDPSKSAFAQALFAFFQQSRETREEKLQLYRRWCFSEKEIWSAFKRTPVVLRSSKKKINKILVFLVHKMGYQPSDVAHASSVFNYSLERRIILRFSVIRALQLKGLIEGNVALSTALRMPEEHFLGKFVFNYQEEAPELLSIFWGDMSMWETSVFPLCAG